MPVDADTVYLRSRSRRQGFITLLGISWSLLGSVSYVQTGEITIMKGMLLEADVDL